jgi:hypothetical protein
VLGLELSKKLKGDKDHNVETRQGRSAREREIAVARVRAQNREWTHLRFCLSQEACRPLKKT